MPAVRSTASLAETDAGSPCPVGEVLLARIAPQGGATRAEIIADLAGLFSHKLSPAEWRRLAEVHTGKLVAAGLATESRNRLKATDAGLKAASRYFGRKVPADWATVRDHALIAKSLGLERETASRLKMMGRPEGLRALILQKAFRLSFRKNPSPAKLRAQLALVALERAFGNKVKKGLGKGSSFTAKAGRTLAGQLSLNPREFPTDQKLIAGLAAEKAGALQTDFESLRKSLLKQLGAAVLVRQAAVEPRVVRTADHALPEPANDRAPPPASKTVAERPDLQGFAQSIQAAARTCAEGWPGNRKAFISQVWEAIRAAKSAWNLTEIEFKCMLAEAHRAGSVVLATADLKDKSKIEELKRSAISYKNTVWHFVRVED